MQSRLLLVGLLALGVVAESPGQIPLTRDEEWARMNRSRTLSTAPAPVDRNSEPWPIEAWIVGGIVGAGFMIARSRRMSIVEAIEEREATHPIIPQHAAVHIEQEVREVA